MSMYYWQIRLYSGEEYTIASNLGLTIQNLINMPMSVERICFMPKADHLPKIALKPELFCTLKTYELWYLPFEDMSRIIKEQVICQDQLRIVINLTTGIVNISYV